MGREPLFCVVRCDAQQIGARKPQFFNEKIADVRDRLKGVNSSHGRLIKFGGEGEIRTDERRWPLPVFKSDGSHASGTYAHAIAIIADGSSET